MDDFEKDAEALRDRCKEVAAILAEHCDSLVILATLSYGDSSTMIYQTRGNIYAAQQSCYQFLEMKRTQYRVRDEKEAREEE